jgi:uncharacterized protein
MLLFGRIVIIMPEEKRINSQIKEKPMNSQIIEKTRQFAQNHFDGDASGHDWWHVHRVWQMAKKIAQSEGAEVALVEIAALLHDVADWKLSEDGEEAGMRQVRDFLSERKSARSSRKCRSRARA